MQRSLPTLCGVLLTLACAKPSADDGRDPTGGVTTETDSDSSEAEAGDSDGNPPDDGDGDGDPDGDGDGDGDGDDGPKFDLGTPDDLPPVELVPVKDLPNLESITFYERTGGAAPDPFTFTVNGPELTVRLDDPLLDNNHDIPGATGEFYDVYYSDEDGGYQLDGSYLTISGTFTQTLPAGGGLNLAEISLDFSDQTVEYGNYVASFAALGDNAVPENVERAIDGDLQTHTTMGNTVGQMDRLRVTLGFDSTSGPPG
ncbi:hypothetical protein [Enhygromyxa salina]|uniref:Uncharacterized protein n=1 Tax=Enhygromyxa salina TaxID=215803 RepID=A0A2S9YFD0_9BACT|nr:hypothetical protein [Enhygromyxa salina]PRQ03827.1 hypothetical protein ENSA7_52940 [Enhygromyxa salina]